MAANPLHAIENNFQTSLSRKEMLEISNYISKEYAPVHSKKLTNLSHKIKLSREELLKVSQNISLYYAPKIASSVKKLVVLPIDQEHFYIYWNIGDNHDFTLSQSISNQQLVLRVYAQAVKKEQIVKLKPVIEHPINKLQSGQKISLPQIHNSSSFSASIGQTLSNNSFVPLLISSHTDVVHVKTEQKKTIGAINLGSNKTLGKQIHEKGLFDSPRPVKSHYASTNYSAKGKKR